MASPVGGGGGSSGGLSAPDGEVMHVNQVDEEGLDPALEEDQRDPGLLPEESDDEPDVLLDVPELRVDEISLEVEDLRARVALQADVLSLLKLHVGVEAELGRVQLTIKGVEAQALLKVRLDNVARIIDRVLTTIDKNPDIVEGLIEQLGTAAEEVGAGIGQALGELAPGAGSAVEEAGTAVGGVGTASEELAQGAAEVVENVAEEPRQKRQRRGKPRQSTEEGAEGRGRRSKAGASRKKRPTRSSRNASDRRSEEA